MKDVPLSILLITIICVGGIAFTIGHTIGFQSGVRSEQNLQCMFKGGKLLKAKNDWACVDKAYLK